LCRQGRSRLARARSVVALRKVGSARCALHQRQAVVAALADSAPTPPPPAPPSKPQDRSIFPLALTVTRLSGTGQESIFMGVLRCAVRCAGGSSCSRRLGRQRSRPRSAALTARRSSPPACLYHRRSELARRSSR
jgi:hypothetical protein